MAAKILRAAMVMCGIGFALPNAALGQDRSAYQGDRIRVHLRDARPRRVIGELLSFSSDTLSFHSADVDYSIAIQAISKLEVSTGEKSRSAGTVIGIITGGLLGAAIGFELEKATTDSCRDSCGLGGGFLGLVAGGFGGGIAGYVLLGKEIWMQVPLQETQNALGSATIQFRIAL